MGPSIDPPSFYICPQVKYNPFKKGRVKSTSNNSPLFSLLLSQLKGATRLCGRQPPTLLRAPAPSQPRRPRPGPRRLARGHRAACLLRGAAMAGHLHPDLGPSRTPWSAGAAGRASDFAGTRAAAVLCALCPRPAAVRAQMY